MEKMPREAKIVYSASFSRLDFDNEIRRAEEIALSRRTAFGYCGPMHRKIEDDEAYPLYVWWWVTF